MLAEIRLPEYRAHIERNPGRVRSPACRGGGAREIEPRVCGGGQRTGAVVDEPQANKQMSTEFFINAAVEVVVRSAVSTRLRHIPRVGNELLLLRRLSENDRHDVHYVVGIGRNHALSSRREEWGSSKVLM